MSGILEKRSPIDINPGSAGGSGRQPHVDVIDLSRHDVVRSRGLAEMLTGGHVAGIGTKVRADRGPRQRSVVVPHEAQLIVARLQAENLALRSVEVEARQERHLEFDVDSRYRRPRCGPFLVGISRNSHARADAAFRIERLQCVPLGRGDNLKQQVWPKIAVALRNDMPIGPQ